MAGGSASTDVVTLDPYQCIPKRNRKYASECTEVHLSNKGAEKISEEFCHFASLEVVWFNGNRLSRIENLDHNFRIREIFLDNNRLVSLSGLKSFKFLRVLLASNNQLRNLDKQLALLSRFAFLRKLELFDNPVAEEPDYRMRVIYHVPQVELLDRHAVKGPERLRAEEVVPNMDKVSASKPKPKPKGPGHSVLEEDCFRMASSILDRRRREEENTITQSFARVIDPKAGVAKRFHKEFKLDPTKAEHQDPHKPSTYEKYEMRPLIEKKAGKTELTREDVAALAKELARDGVEEVGRVLSTADVFKQPTLKGGGVQHPLEKIMGDPEAAMPTSDVANWLLTLSWPHPDHHDNDRHVKKVFSELRYAENPGDADANEAAKAEAAKTKAALTQKIFRLTRGHSFVGHRVSTTMEKPIKREVSLEAVRGSVPRTRGDIFKQSMLQPLRGVDGGTGRMTVGAKQLHRHTAMGNYGASLH